MATIAAQSLRLHPWRIPALLASIFALGGLTAWAIGALS